MKKYHHIITCIDFSSASRIALREALRWAAFDGAKVTALHVMEEHVAVQLRKALGLDDAHLHKEVMDRLKGFLTESEAGTELVVAEVRIGHPFVQIAQACKEHSADLLVMGSRGAQHALNQVGVIAGKCVRKAPADVLLVKENVVGPYKRVLACVDMSETSAKAVQCARHVAEEDGARLDCLYVYQSTMALAVDYGGMIPPTISDFDAERAEASRKDLEKFVAPLLRSEKPLQATCVVVEQLNVRDAIITFIEDNRSDLVVLGTRGKTDLRTLIMGTTAESVVAHAPCSILAVKPDGFQYRTA